MASPTTATSRPANRSTRDARFGLTASPPLGTLPTAEGNVGIFTPAKNQPGRLVERGGVVVRHAARTEVPFRFVAVVDEDRPTAGAAACLDVVEYVADEPG